MNRLKDYDTMKGITIILVVFAHVTRMFAPQGVVPITYSPLLTEITNFIYVFHMPAFVAITGSIYYFVKREKKRYNDPFKFAINKAKRLLLPFLFFSIIVVLPVLYYLGLRENIFKFIVLEVFMGSSSTHLWYSVMLFIVFVLFNSFEKRLVKNKEWLNWLILVILFTVSFFVPYILQISNVLRYPIYFYAGYWFQQNKKIIVPVLNNNFILNVITVVVTYVILFHTVVGDILFINIALQLVGGLSGTAMLYVISDKLSHSNMTENKYFIEIVDSSYGIYLFHPMIIYLLSYWEQGTNLNPYLLVTINFIISFFLSILLVRLMRKMNLQVFIGDNKPKVKMAKEKPA